MAYTGRCACQAVTIAIDAEPVAVRQCWCRQCQQIASGNATVNAIFPTEAITIAGALSWSSYKADSGNTLTRGFCPACGTPVINHVSARPHLGTVRLGVLDQPHGLTPQTVIWTDAAPTWAIIPDHLERFSGQPPAPVMPK